MTYREPQKTGYYWPKKTSRGPFSVCLFVYYGRVKTLIDRDHTSIEKYHRGLQ